MSTTLLKDHMRNIGIPIAQVGDRLEKLNEAVAECGMAIGAEMGYRLNTFIRNPEDKEQIVASATIDVYFFDEPKKEG